jgi:Tol biopolymer transport system component
VYGGVAQYGPVQISRDGRFVVVINTQTGDITLHDRQTNTTELVYDYTGQLPVMPDGDRVSVSANGRYVRFEREDASGPQVYRYDRQTATTTQISAKPNGQPYQDASFGYAQMTPNGRYVLYLGWGAEMPDGYTLACPGFQGGYCAGAFLYDMQSQRTTRISLNSQGEPANGYTSQAAISDNGRYVVFISNATNLGGQTTDCVVPVEGGSYPCFYLYLRDRHTGLTREITGADGRPLPEISVPATLFGLSFSGNGRYVVYTYNNSLSGDSDSVFRVFIYDALLGMTEELIAPASDGQPGDTIHLGNEAISDDGRFILYETSDFASTIRIYDRITGVHTRLSDSDGNPLDDLSFNGIIIGALGISGDGEEIVYWGKRFDGEIWRDTIFAAQGQAFDPAPYSEVELIQNGGAEAGGGLTREAQGWQTKDYRAGRRRCDYFPKTGECAFQLSALKDKTVRYVQSVPAMHDVGDTLTLSADVRGFDAARASIRALITYVDGTTQTITLPRAQMDGSYDYKRVTATGTLTKRAYTIKVQMGIERGGTGRLLVDDVSLMLGSGTPAATPDLVPLPPAP